MSKKNLLIIVTVCIIAILAVILIFYFTRTSQNEINTGFNALSAGECTVTDINNLVSTSLLALKVKLIFTTTAVVVSLLILLLMLIRSNRTLITSLEKRTKDVEKHEHKLKKAVEQLMKFQEAVEHSSDLMIITDAEGVVIYANRAVKDVTGFAPEETIGRKAGSKTLWGGNMPTTVYEDLWKTIKIDKKTYHGEFENKKKGGKKYIAESSITPILDENKEVKFFIAVERDITKAKEIDRMKTEFISLASHQLRTPLSAIKWYLELLLSGDMGKLTAKQIDFLTTIDQSNNRMVVLVNTLLNISRIESGKIVVESEPVLLLTLIQSVLTELEKKISAKKLAIQVDVGIEVGAVNTDPKLIRNVYLNLISNAIKYSPDESQIKITVKVDGDEVLSTVEDNGYGIPVDDQENIFQRFFRASNAVKIETDGTGLGLYLAKDIVNTCGGKIWFESELNKGTKFYFTLPYKINAQSSHQKTENSQPINSLV